MEYKLPKKIKTRWLNDLRSGKFKQGRERLLEVDDDGSREFCCLGVLATQWHDPNRKSKREKLSFSGGLLESRLKIPPPVAKALSQEPSARLKKMGSDDYDSYSVEASLVDLNDCRLKSFKQIANIIEKHL
jgi:hypothetical protein